MLKHSRGRLPLRAVPHGHGCARASTPPREARVSIPACQNRASREPWLWDGSIPPREARVGDPELAKTGQAGSPGRRGPRASTPPREARAGDPGLRRKEGGLVCIFSLIRFAHPGLRTPPPAKAARVSIPACQNRASREPWLSGAPAEVRGLKGPFFHRARTEALSN